MFPLIWLREEFEGIPCASSSAWAFWALEVHGQCAIFSGFQLQCRLMSATLLAGAVQNFCSRRCTVLLTSMACAMHGEP